MRGKLIMAAIAFSAALLTFECVVEGRVWLDRDIEPNCALIAGVANSQECEQVEDSSEQSDSLTDALD